MSDLSIFQSIEITYIDKFLQSYFNANNYKIKKYTRYLNFVYGMNSVFSKDTN